MCDNLEMASIREQNKDFESVEENLPLKLTFMSSLKNIVTVKIVTNLDMNKDIEQIIINYFKGDFMQNESNPDFKEITSKLSELPVSESIAEKLINIVSMELNNADKRELMFNLFSRLHSKQQEEILKKCYRSILRSILPVDVYRNDFFKFTLHILNNINPDPYFYLLENLRLIMRQELNRHVWGEEQRNTLEINDFAYFHYKSIFRELWQQSSKLLNDIIFDEDHKQEHSLEKLVALSLSLTPDTDIIKLVFNDLNAQQKKYLFFGYYGLRYCFYLMLYNQWDLLELFINHTLSSEKDISRLKQTFVEDKGYNIDEFFLEEMLDKVHYFWGGLIKYAGESNQLINHPAFVKVHRWIRNIPLFKLFPEMTVQRMNGIFRDCFEACPTALNWFESHSSELYSWISTIFALFEEKSYKDLDTEIGRTILISLVF